MKTAWSEFIDWKSAREAVKEAREKFTASADDCAKKTTRIAEVLRTRGPIVHSGHVYSLRCNEIICEPCVDSLSVNLEE